MHSLKVIKTLKLIKHIEISKTKMQHTHICWCFKMCFLVFVCSFFSHRSEAAPARPRAVAKRRSTLPARHRTVRRSRVEARKDTTTTTKQIQQIQKVQRIQQPSNIYITHIKQMQHQQTNQQYPKLSCMISIFVYVCVSFCVLCVFYCC